MRHAVATLHHFGVPPEEKEDVVAFVASLEGEIVEGT